MAYTTIKKPSDYFNTLLYAGNSTAGRSITGVGFAPDFLWLKDRTTQGSAHFLSDTVRGDGKWLRTNGDFAENTDTNVITSLDSDGFTVGTDIYSNNTGDNYVAWNWLASNTTASNTDGSITSTVSANTTSGFSIVSFTATGSTATIGHGLGSAPKVVIIKDRDATGNWYTYHESIGNTKAIYLDLTNAESGASSNFWNNTSPTTDVFSIGSAFNANAQIAYCFAEKQGFSKFGSYVGNGNADGTFVYTGFKPKLVIVKEYGSTGNWIMKNDYIDNQNDHYLLSNETDREESGAVVAFDLLSNGFKLRGTAGDSNGSGNSILYMAFAEEPLVGDNPATAR